MYKLMLIKLVYQYIEILAMYNVIAYDKFG
jgi:hypothetical protein